MRKFLIFIGIFLFISCNTPVLDLKDESQLIEEVKFSTFENYYQWILLDNGMVNKTKNIRVIFNSDSTLLIEALDRHNISTLHEISLKRSEKTENIYSTLLRIKRQVEITNIYKQLK